MRDLKKDEGILVYRLGSLGDTLLALPAYHLIRRARPDSKMVLLTNMPVNGKAAPAREILNGVDLFDHVIEYPVRLRSAGGLLALRRQIKQERLSLGVYLMGGNELGRTVRDYVFLRWAGIKSVVGMTWKRVDRRCRWRSDLGRYEWEAERLARRVRFFGEVNLAGAEWWSLQLTEAELRGAEGRIRGKGISGRFIAASVGAKADVKDWTDNNWSELVRLLAQGAERSHGLVFVGSRDERGRCEALLQGWRGEAANFCGDLTVRESAAVLKRASMFVGHDSGPMHLAATVGTPCVAVFSARGLPGQWWPRGDRNKIFYNQTPCFGCELDVCIQWNKKCILGIKPDAVAGAVCTMLERTP